MVRIIFRLLLIPIFGASFGESADAATFYVATDGDDQSVGTIDAPFASIERAQKDTRPGDTVLVRGGVYRMTDDDIMQRTRIFARVIVLDRSGQPDQPITYRAYPNERPVFDFASVRPDGYRVTAFYVAASWLHLDGIDVTGVQVTIQGHTQSICFENAGDHNRYERLSMHDGQAIGVYSIRGRDNLFLNCDAWNNWDDVSENGQGGNVDGFGCHPSRGATGNRFVGCRAWFNSDDGYDCIHAHEAVTFENCWAFANGYSATGQRLADGNGFKIGGFAGYPMSRLPPSIPRHQVIHCIALGNKNSGFYANHHLGGNDWIENIAIGNGANFNMLCRLPDNETDVDGYDQLLRGNVGAASRGLIVRMNRSRCELIDNRFDATLDEFGLSNLSTATMSQARSPDGTLPLVNGLLLPFSKSLPSRSRQ
ncbi:right-handed parallel beta-helix repeat-containing protein [Neorhodopirellula pilleata]|uniref:Pectate lyase L n=1 Tax=Neorhodopirellula pilleata TaxID=2714738 RepID=A0A5C6AP61_9BACT|nr:pectate lyase [Neorhodopirellula pilleata]TWU01793.1 Pectate lyase L precursor [Neorhodopirellula pilleata]